MSALTVANGGFRQKGAFVNIMLELACVYRLVLQSSWESASNTLAADFKRVACKADPDKGGKR